MTVVGVFGPEVVLNGNVLTAIAMASTSITVKNPDNSAATLYTSTAGTSTTSNVISTDSRGSLTFYAAPGPYKLVYTDSVGAQTLTVEVFESALVTNATYVPATIATGTGIDPTGAVDSSSAIQALITGIAAGGALLFPNGIYKLATGLTINKTMRFGALTATRTSNDNSDPSAGVQFVYTATSGDAILVQPPNSTNSRISPTLHNFLVRGNIAIGGAAAGGGIKLDGRNLSGTAISGFVVEDVHVSEAKGSGLTIDGMVYEGRFLGFNSTDNGARGVSCVPSAGTPGELVWIDTHCHDNLTDGFYVSAASSMEFLRISASRNTATGITLSGLQFAVMGAQLESNTGNAMVCDTFVKGSIDGLFVAYGAGNNHGLVISGASGGALQGKSFFFSGSTTGKDISMSGSADGARVDGYVQSAASKLTISTGSVVFNGSTATAGAIKFRGVKAYCTSSPTSVVNNTATAVAFNAEAYDTDAFHDTVTNNDRITIPTGMDGKYGISAGVVMASNAAANYEVHGELYKNGSRVCYNTKGSGPGGINATAEVSTTLLLAAGDYLQFKAYQNCGSNLNTLTGEDLCWFEAKHLGS